MSRALGSRCVCRHAQRFCGKNVKLEGTTFHVADLFPSSLATGKLRGQIYILFLVSRDTSRPISYSILDQAIIVPEIYDKKQHVLKDREGNGAADHSSNNYPAKARHPEDGTVIDPLDTSEQGGMVS